MRSLLTLLLLTFIGLPQAAAQGADVWILGGHLIDGIRDEAVLNPGILVRAGQFHGFGRNGDFTHLNADPSAPGATVVRLADDQYILPGLFDLHAHHAIDLFGEGRIDDTGSYPAIFLANGVTSVFPGGEMQPENMRALRLRIERGEQAGPRLYNSGPYFGAWRPGWDPNTTRAQLFAEVDEWTTLGVRSFKAKGIAPIHLQALIERAHQHGATVTGHLDSGFRNSVNPRDAIAMGIDRVEHFLGGDAFDADRPAYASLVEFDPASPEFASIARQYIQHRVFFDATLTAYGYYGERDPDVYTYWRDERTFFTPYVQRLIDQRGPRPINEQFERIYWVKRRTVKAFYDAGGGDLITLGTDHPSWGEFVSGFAAHRELHAMVLAGIPPIDAIRIGTINGARALNVSAYLGTIEAGKFADLFVVNGNPLEDIRNTRNVAIAMKAGQVHDATQLLDRVVGTIGPRNAAEEAAWKPAARR